MKPIFILNLFLLSEFNPVLGSDTLHLPIRGFYMDIKGDLSPTNIGSERGAGYVYISTATGFNSVYSLGSKWSLEIPFVIGYTTYRGEDFRDSYYPQENYYIKTLLTELHGGILVQRRFGHWWLSAGTHAGWTLYEKTQLFRGTEVVSRARGHVHTDPLLSPRIKISNVREFHNGEMLSVGAIFSYTHFFESFYSKPEVISAGIEIGWYVRQKRSYWKRAGA